MNLEPSGPCSSQDLLHPLFDGTYFKVIERNGNKISCVCVLCGNKKISAAITTTSNLYTHLHRVHDLKDSALEYVAHMRSGGKRKLQSGYVNPPGPTSFQNPLMFGAHFGDKLLHHNPDSFKHLNDGSSRIYSEAADLCTPSFSESSGSNEICSFQPMERYGKECCSSSIVSSVRDPDAMENCISTTSEKQHKRIKDGDIDLKMIKGKVSRVSQSTIDSMIKAFIIQGIHPLNTLDEPAFREIIKCINPEAQILTSHNLEFQINLEVTENREKIKSALNGAQYVSLTMDIWSVGQKKATGIAAHWIDPVTRVWHGLVLCCKIHDFNITYDSCTSYLKKIAEEYSLMQGKIVSIVTDNVCDSSRSFRELGVNINHFNYCLTSNDKNVAHANIDEKEDLSSQLVVDIKCENIDEDLSNDFRGSQNVYQMLCLVGSESLHLFMQTEGLTSMHNATMSKCASLWNNYFKMLPSEEDQFSNWGIKIPSRYRWESILDSIIAIVDHVDIVNELSTSLNLSEFTYNEIEYMEEFKVSMTPLCLALKRLSSRSNSYYGELIPTLITIENQLEQMELRKFKYCYRLLESLSHNFKSKFRNFLTCDLEDKRIEEAIIATVAHPYFKLRWLRLKKSWDDKTVNTMVTLVTNAFKSTAREFSEVIKDTKDSNISSDYDEYFGFEDKMQRIYSNSDVESMVQNYLNDQDYDMKCLNNHPLIQKIFIKYNSILISPTSVMNLFIFQDELPHPGKLSMKDFENIVQLRANSRYFSTTAETIFTKSVNS